MLYISVHVFFFQNETISVPIFSTSAATPTTTNQTPTIHEFDAAMLTHQLVPLDLSQQRLDDGDADCDDDGKLEVLDLSVRTAQLVCTVVEDVMIPPLGSSDASMESDVMSPPPGSSSHSNDGSSGFFNSEVAEEDACQMETSLVGVY